MLPERVAVSDDDGETEGMVPFETVALGDIVGLAKTDALSDCEGGVDRDADVETVLVDVSDMLCDTDDVTSALDVALADCVTDGTADAATLIEADDERLALTVVEGNAAMLIEADNDRLELTVVDGEGLGTVDLEAERVGLAATDADADTEALAEVDAVTV